MADYIKLRLTGAKIGVSMAVLGLIAGIAERAHANAQPSAQPAAAKFLKLAGLTSTISYDFVKLETKMVKLTNRVAALETKYAKLQTTLSKSFYNSQKADRTFLKIADAATQYLKVTDANQRFLPASAAASFYQGKGNVVSGALSAVSPTSQELLSLPGGIIVVSIADVPAAGRVITIHNGTSETLGIAVEGTGGTPPTSLKPNGDTNLPAVQDSSTTSTEIRLQIFPGTTFTNVVSILIGLTPNPASGFTEAVAQAFTGGV